MAALVNHLEGSCIYDCGKRIEASLESILRRNYCQTNTVPGEGEKQKMTKYKVVIDEMEIGAIRDFLTEKKFEH